MNTNATEKNSVEKITVADNCCAICSKTSCDACPVKDLVSENYDSVVELLLDGYTVPEIVAALKGVAV